MPEIKTVVFDVGWVLVHLDYAPLLAYLAGTGHRYDMKEVIAAIDLEAHEKGQLNGMQLLDNFMKLAPGLDRATLQHHWTNMFTPVEPMFDLVRKLSTTHSVYLLSNAGDLHWTHLNQQYQLLSLGHGALPSFEAGVMKPNHEIYRLAENRFGLDPATTVFIDDLTPNVEGARQCGWYAIRHVSADETIEALKRLGVG